MRITQHPVPVSWHHASAWRISFRMGRSGRDGEPEHQLNSHVKWSMGPCHTPYDEASAQRHRMMLY